MKTLWEQLKDLQAQLPDNPTLAPIIEQLLITAETQQVQLATLEAEHQAMQRQQQFYERIFHEAPLPYIVTDQNSIIRAVSQRAAHLLNTQSQYLLGKPMAVFMTEESRISFRYRLLDVIRGHKVLRWEAHLKPRRQDSRTVFFTVAMLENTEDTSAAPSLLWLLDDITQARQAAIQEQDVLFRTTFEQAPLGIGHIGYSGNWLRVNRQFCAITGYSESELLNLSHLVLTAPEDHHLMPEKVHYPHTRAMTAPIEKRYLRKDGSLVWVRVTVATIRTASSHFLHNMVTIEDITERKQLEVALQIERVRKEGEQQRASTILESISDAFAALDQEYRFSYVNSKAIELFRVLSGKRHIAGQKLDDLFDEVTRSVFAPVYAMLTRRVPAVTDQYFAALKAWYEVRVYVMPDGFTIYFQEITERKLAEALEKEQRQFAEGMYNIALALNSSLALSEVLERILDQVQQVVAHDYANITLLEGEKVLIARERGEIPSEQITATFLQIGSSVLHQIVATGQPLIVRDVQQQPEISLIPQQQWVRAYLGVPIFRDEKILGFISLSSATPNAFTESHIERLKVFTTQAGVAIYNAQLHEQSRQLAVMEERQRLARDLHDAVSQTLFAASLMAESLPNTWKHYPEEALAQIEELAVLNRSASAEMRLLLLELRPEHLLKASLSQNLGHLTNALRARRQVEVTLATEELQPIPPDVQITFFRIAQEAINNITKHAQATAVQVHLVSNMKRVTLTISDNGRGFDVKRVAMGFGLGSMQERANAIFARLKVKSSPQQGTQITVTWTRS